ncbi:hypothetical protein [Streptomyces sp. NPDC048527]|uniref:hypothetical protein n=1 Tax=Streptomyces sp. NPDC048527 TaxID=3365568 RepID=UPI003710F31F
MHADGGRTAPGVGRHRRELLSGALFHVVDVGVGHRLPDAVDQREGVSWVKQWNENPTPFTWTKTAEEILDSLARF